MVKQYCNHYTTVQLTTLYCVGEEVMLLHHVWGADVWSAHTAASLWHLCCNL